MSIISAIRSADYGKYISRGIGAAALYFVARDAHNCAKIQADADLKTKNAEAAHYYLNNTLSLDKASVTKNNLQNTVFRYEMGNDFRGFVNSFIGYFKGGINSLVNDVVPLTLALGALCARGRGLFLAKASAIGLAGFGCYSFIKDGLGIGKSAQ